MCLFFNLLCNKKSKRFELEIRNIILNLLEIKDWDANLDLILTFFMIYSGIWFYKIWYIRSN
jgi:hypothetical protein